MNTDRIRSLVRSSPVPRASNTRSIRLATLTLLVFYSGQTHSKGQEQPLRLVKTIPLPNLKGRIDHMDVDVRHLRLFVAGLENGSIEVVDLQAGRWLRSVPGFRKPQGIAYLGSLNKLFVSSGDDGMVRVFRGDTLDLLDSIKLELGPNRVTYDPTHGLLYVGYGGKDAGKDYGEVAIIDVNTDQHIGDVRVAAHPAELLLDKSGMKLWALVPAASKVQVIDTVKRLVISDWSVSSQRPGDAALDESSRRLFIGTRTPSEMVVMNSESGNEVAHLPTVEAMDGVYFDAARKRVYVSGGAGFIFVYKQRSADDYELTARVTTRAGAGTAFWSSELNRYYVAAPANNGDEAAILVFEPGQ